MLVESSVYPAKIQIVNYEKGNAVVKLRKNIKEKEIENEEGTDIIYEYEETEVVLANRNNIKEYMENNFEILFEEGIAKENAIEPPTLEERLEALEEMELERLMSS